MLLRKAPSGLLGLALLMARLAPAQSDAELRIPPIKSSLQIEGQTIAVTAWGTILPGSAGTFHLVAMVDLADLQEHLAPVLAAQLNRSERCGERLSVERATLAPAAPAALLTAYVHYERFACAKAFGKEIVKRLVGGNATVEVSLTPAAEEGWIGLKAEVRKIDADGSLGDLLRSASFGDGLRQRIAASVESAIRKAADLKSTLPPAVAGRAAIERVRFERGQAGQLLLATDAEVRVSPDELRGISRALGR